MKNLSKLAIAVFLSTFSGVSGTCVDHLSSECSNTPSVRVLNSKEARDLIDSEGRAVIPYGYTAIGDSAFDQCSDLKEIIIPNSVTTIGEYAFARCTNLSNINISSSVTTIKKGAFSGESKFPKKMYCGRYYFLSGYSGLTEITIPGSVKHIGDNAFSGCTFLKNVTMEEGVISIGEKAFYNSGLTNITIPNSLTSIGDDAFSGCSELTEIKLPCGLTTIGDSSFGMSGLRKINIPSSVTTIKEFAFGLCSNLTEVNMPDNITAIEDWVFYSCENLTNVTILGRISFVGTGAFANCPNLQKVEFLGGVKDDIFIGYDVFTRSSNVTLVVPEEAKDKFSNLGVKIEVK